MNYRPPTDHFAGAAKAPYVNLAAFKWALSRTECKANRRSVLIELARNSDEFGCSYWSAKRLARELGISDRTVRNCLRDLEEQALIRRIGRAGKHRAQISNVVVVGWPERKRLPRSGHPSLGRTVREKKLDELNAWAMKRNVFPGAPETVAGQNKYYSITDTATSTEVDAANSILDLCLEALGAWATESNRRLLSADAACLEDFFDKGADLNRHVLPVLRQCGERKKVPNLRSWAYFNDMIVARLEITPQAPLPEDDDNISPSEHRTSDTGAERGNKAHRTMTGQPDAEMSVILRRMTKPIPGVAE